jgi:hypothetical protein
MVDAFILGVERSATTWVSNIIESHPETRVYMEPLSRNVSGLRSWPRRFVEVEESTLWSRYFQREFERVKEQGRFFLTRCKDNEMAWKIDAYFASLAAEYMGLVSANDFNNLNFHRINSDYSFPKSKQNLCVVKEVRLNYNTDILKEVNSDVKVIVPLRGYGPVVKSIKKYFRKGSLIELREDLSEEYGEYMSEEVIFDYWYKSYNSLLKGMDRNGIDYKVLYHEDLIKGGQKVSDIFAWLGVEKTPTIDEYISESQTEGEGKHTTKRDPGILLDNMKESMRYINSKSFIKDYPKGNPHELVERYFCS